MPLRLPSAIETGRLRIRRHEPRDEEAFVAFMTDGEATRHLLFTAAEKTGPGARALFQQNMRLYVTKDGIFSLTIADKETDTFIGACGLNPVEMEPKAREIFYDIIPAYQGRGYAREACEALVAAAFGTLDIPKVIGFLRPENIRAVAVAEHLGFQDHGPAMKHGRAGRRYVLTPS